MRRLNVPVCLILLNLPALIVMNMTDNVNRFHANRQSVWVFSTLVYKPSLNLLGTMFGCELIHIWCNSNYLYLNDYLFTSRPIP